MWQNQKCKKTKKKFKSWQNFKKNCHNYFCHILTQFLQKILVKTNWAALYYTRDVFLSKLKDEAHTYITKNSCVSEKNYDTIHSSGIVHSPTVHSQF